MRADWTLNPWHHNSSNVGGVTAGLGRDTTQVMLGVSLRARRRTNQVMLGVSVRTRWDTTLVGIIQLQCMEQLS